MQPTETAQRIKARREALGIPQWKLARAAGISRTGLIFIETGLRQPKPETVDKLVKALDRAEHILTRAA